MDTMSLKTPRPAFRVTWVPTKIFMNRNIAKDAPQGASQIRLDSQFVLSADQGSIKMLLTPPSANSAWLEHTKTKKDNQLAYPVNLDSYQTLKDQSGAHHAARAHL